MSFDAAVSPRKVALILAGLALYFALQGAVVEYVLDIVPEQASNRSFLLALDLFSVNTEESIPTWYATLLLFAAAALLATIAWAAYGVRARDRHYWAGLALIFLYLSMDEGAVIHEIAADAIQTALLPTGFLTFGWQLAAAPLLIVFGLLYLRFLVRLSPRTRRWFILAGVVYVGGAFFVEGISANQWYIDGGATMTYLLIATLEEFCEMIGVVLFIYALLDYCVHQQYAFVVRPVSDGHHPAGSAPSGSRIVFSHPLAAVVLVVVVLNVALLYWATRQPAAPDADTRPAALSTLDILETVITDQVQVTRLIGRFGLENLPARQTAAAHLDIFDQVIIVTTTQGSIVLAGDALPFDRSSLAALLSTSGEGQFVIFDTSAVRAIVGTLQPGAAGEPAN